MGPQGGGHGCGQLPVGAVPHHEGGSGEVLEQVLDGVHGGVLEEGGEPDCGTGRAGVVRPGDQGQHGEGLQHVQVGPVQAVERAQHGHLRAGAGGQGGEVGDGRVTQVRPQREQPLEPVVRPPRQVVRQGGGPHRTPDQARRLSTALATT